MNTQHRSRLLVPLATVAASALVLSACGSSGGGGKASASDSPASSSASSSAAASTPASSSAAPTTADSSAVTSAKATLQGINVRATDLPAGYKATPADPTSGNDDLGPQLQTCTGVKGAPDSHKVATVPSDDFTKGNITVSSEFATYRSQSDVRADVALINSPKINQCLNSVFKTSLAKSLNGQGSITGATVKLTPGSNGGPKNVVALAQGTVGVTANGKQTTIYLGIAFVTGPKLDGTLTYVGIGEGLDPSTAGKTLALVAQRAQRA